MNKDSGLRMILREINELEYMMNVFDDGENAENYKGVTTVTRESIVNIRKVFKEMGVDL